MQLSAGGRLIASDNTAPYSFTWQSAPRTGLVPLELRAADRKGNLTVVRRSVRADNTAPALRLVKKGRTLTARAADPSGVARLELVVNGKVTARTKAALRTFAVPERARTVKVRAVDRAGNVRVVNGKLGG